MSASDKGENLPLPGEVLMLPIEAQRQLAEAILNPPEPNEKLKRAIRESRKLKVP